MVVGSQQRKIELPCASAAVSPGALDGSCMTRLELMHKVTGHKSLCLIFYIFNLVMAAIARATVSGCIH